VPFSLSFSRSQFEYEKNTNVKQVEQMRTMEMNLITMTKEAEKLRADVSNAEKRAQGKYPHPLDVFPVISPCSPVWSL
jgi:hypothetical protein